MKTERSSSKSRSRRPNPLINIGCIIVILLVMWIAFKHEVSPVAPSDRSQVRVEIQKGDRSIGIAAMLADNGLARSKYIALAAIVLSGQAGSLKAGHYALSRSMSLHQMIDLIARGKTDTVSIVVPEGFTAEQIADRLDSAGLADRKTFLDVVYHDGESLRFSDGFAPPGNLEGYLFPLTYTINRGSSPRQIAYTMVSEFDRHIVAVNPDVRDWRQPVIMASMIEREAKLDSDRPLIASVYFNRLRRNMPLQCDATVQFALPLHKARLLYSDLKVESPYNTYRHRGLPPGPICSPGVLSIAAALKPAHTSYLYYVAGQGGAHIFSDTLAQQDRAISSIRNLVQ